LVAYRRLAFPERRELTGMTPERIALILYLVGSACFFVGTLINFVRGW
jgi:hypothetical protein